MAPLPKILIVDDRPENLYTLQRLLQKLPVQVFSAASGNEALGLAIEHDFCVAIVDVQMPEMDGYELVELLRGFDNTATLPVIFVSAVYSDEYHHRKGYESGAVDFISKPFVPGILLSKVRVFLELYNQRLVLQETVLRLSDLNMEVMDLNSTLEDRVRERTRELELTHQEVIRQLGRAAEVRDEGTHRHVERVSHYVKLLAQAAGVESERAELYFTIAPLHDIGKIGIPDHILLKPGPLTPEEVQVMRKHAELGARIIGDYPADLLRTAKMACLTHHERWDGKGYPRGLAGEQIPLIGRLVALADVFDAVTSNRPYKKAWPLPQALDLVRQELGHHFDSTLGNLFLQHETQVVEIHRTYAD